MGLEIYWGAAEPPGRDLAARIAFVDQAGDVAQAEQMALYPSWPSSQWTSDAIVIGRYRVRVGAHLPPGEYDVRIGMADLLTDKPIGDSATVATLEAKPVARTYELPVPQFDIGGCFGDRLCVLGYDVVSGDEHIEITFYWQGTRLMERDYAMSIRLMDPSSGARVWAEDSAPRGWTYPTTWWDVGEVVSDTVVCDLSDVPYGRYQLAVVAYEPQSGEVLAPSTAGPSGQPVEGAASLPFEWEGAASLPFEWEGAASLPSTSGGTLLLGEVEVP